MREDEAGHTGGVCRLGSSPAPFSILSQVKGDKHQARPLHISKSQRDTVVNSAVIKGISSAFLTGNFLGEVGV